MPSTETASDATHASVRKFDPGIDARPGATERIRRGPSRNPELEFAIGDITQEVCDAIVNPAGAGLVDLAVRRGAGPDLLDALHLKALSLPGGKLSAGRAVLTPGFALRAAHVIHCGPPVYADDPLKARDDLAACHAEALRLAREAGLDSVSFPAIGTGVYRYPAAEAAEVAVGTVIATLRGRPNPGLVRFVFRDHAVLKLYFEVARAHLNQPRGRQIVLTAPRGVRPPGLASG